jgi:hypothetical protein
LLVSEGLARAVCARDRRHPDPLPPPAQAYLETRIAAGNTKREVLRALKRRLSDTTYHALLADGTPIPLRQAA